MQSDFAEEGALGGVSNILNGGVHQRADRHGGLQEALSFHLYFWDLLSVLFHEHRASSSVVQLLRGSRTVSSPL